MSDAADFAAELVAAEIAAGLARVDRDIPVGAPGECDECGEEMPRLVGGRCGYCRDGRKPPLSRFDGAPAPMPPAPAPISQLPATEPVMPNPKPSENFQQISFPARDAVLAAIKERARKHDVSFPRAAVELIEIAIETLAEVEAIDASTTLSRTSQSMLALADASPEVLLFEVRRRIENAVAPADLDAATVRADVAEQRAHAAEAKFDRLRAALAQVA